MPGSVSKKYHSNNVLLLSAIKGNFMSICCKSDRSSGHHYWIKPEGAVETMVCWSIDGTGGT